MRRPHPSSLRRTVQKESSSNKRKSVPVKRPLSSISEAPGLTPHHGKPPVPRPSTPTGRGPQNGQGGPMGGGPRKRSRLQFSSAPITHTTDAAPQHHQQQQQHCDDTATAPAVASPAEPLSSMSRDRSTGSSSNPGPNGRAISTSKRGPPPNNTCIKDFFASTMKKSAASSSSSTSGRSNDHSGSATTHVSMTAAVENPTGSTVVSQPSTPANSNITAAASSSSSSSRELERLRQHCHHLEKLCADKDEQLKAVANNQTIMHHALKSSLAQRERELEELKTEMDRRTSVSSTILERWVRSESTRESNVLRQKLASDGARLGRIVYTRAGMHTVESWEDGSAARGLRQRRMELKSMREELEGRQRMAKRAAKKFGTQVTTGTTTTNSSNGTRIRNGLNDGGDDVAAAASGAPDDGGGSVMVVGGVTLRDELDVMEAEESVRMHLATLKQKESELAEEEMALHAEKGSHIRALKRVASEDSSRFKSRPKLHDRYVPLSLLGKGGFSEVWRAYDLTDLKEVAVKIHQLDPRWSDAKKENYTKHVSREYEIHRDVRHPRIVSLYDVFEIDTNSFATVLECCKGTDLDTLLKEKKTLPERDARSILLQILSGMRYLSLPASDGTRQGIIHYDLKPGNILFDEYGDAKITDFGLSKIVDAADPADSMELTSQGAGTYWYLPPECFVTHQSVRISNKVDVWSIGVIYYQMLFGKRPFGDGQSQDKVLSNQTMLNAREVKFPTKPQVSEECKGFVQQCLTYDQTFRPTVSQLCGHQYLHQKL